MFSLYMPFSFDVLFMLTASESGHRLGVLMNNQGSILGPDTADNVILRYSH